MRSRALLRRDRTRRRDSERRFVRSPSTISVRRQIGSSRERGVWRVLMMCGISSAVVMFLAIHVRQADRHHSMTAQLGAQGQAVSDQVKGRSASFMPRRTRALTLMGLRPARAAASMPSRTSPGGRGG